MQIAQFARCHSPARGYVFNFHLKLEWKHYHCADTTEKHLIINTLPITTHIHTHTTSFHHAIMVCPPKKISGEYPALGPFYKATDLRPLSLVNADNRFMASAHKNLVEELARRWVFKIQKGFIQKRSMIRNVLGIDMEAMKVSFKSLNGALLFFDFEAAFPSISQEYLVETLRRVGPPDSLVSYVSAMYSNNACNLSILGELVDGFSIETGVRQGCPLSPLLFVLVVDVLLRKLQTKTPEVVNQSIRG